MNRTFAAESKSKKSFRPFSFPWYQHSANQKHLPLNPVSICDHHASFRLQRNGQSNEVGGKGWNAREVSCAEGRATFLRREHCEKGVLGKNVLTDTPRKKGLPKKRRQKLSAKSQNLQSRLLGSSWTPKWRARMTGPPTKEASIKDFAFHESSVARYVLAIPLHPGLDSGSHSWVHNFRGPECFRKQRTEDKYRHVALFLPVFLIWNANAETFLCQSHLYNFYRTWCSSTAFQLQ